MRARFVAVLGVFGVLVASMTGSLWAQAGDDAARVRQQIIGSYRLVSFVNYDQSGKETPSQYKIGQISYDAAGRMSAQLMFADRARFGSTPPTEAQRSAAYSSYVAYFGRYEIDMKARSVTHHVEGSTNPNMVGSALVRYWEFSPDGNTLYLQTKQGDRVTGRLRWDRHK